jgi:hypothetical protein
MGEKKYTGVCWVERTGSWYARAIVHGHSIDLGLFKSQHEAAFELCKARIEIEKQVMTDAAHEFMKEQKELKADDSKQRSKWDANTPSLADRATAGPSV